MPRLSFTPLKLKSIKPPAAGPAGKVVQVDYWDESLPGFGLRVSSTGARTWVLLTRAIRHGAAKQVRYSLGAYAPGPDDPSGLGLSAARQKAAEWKAAVQRGEDPAEARQRAQRARIDASRQTFEAVATEFLDRYCRGVDPLRASTIRQYEDFLIKTDDFKPLRDRPLGTITKRDIRDVLDDILKRGAPVRANRALATVRKFLNWAVDQDYITASPAAAIDAPTSEEPRERHLFGDAELDRPSEIALAWRAFAAVGRFGPMLQLMLCTGQRRDEVAGMRWDEIIDLQGEAPRWAIPAERTKNGRPHLVPLGALAADIIRAVPRHANSPFLFSGTGATPFSGFSKLKAEVDDQVASLKATGDYEGQLTDGWTLHDLRRTFSTGLIELGVSENVVDALTNHVSGQSRRGVRRHYNHAKHEARKRAAMQAWEIHVQSQIDPARSNVVAMAVA